MDDFDFGPTIAFLEQRREQITAAIDAVKKVAEMYPEDMAPKTSTEKKPSYARSDAKRLTVFWTQERLDELWDMRQSGMKAKQIAHHFDTSEQTIYNQITRLKKERGTVDEPQGSKNNTEPTRAVKAANIIGAEGMTRQQIITLCIQHGWQIVVNAETKEATLYDEVLTDEHLINIAKQYRKTPVVILEAA